MSSRTQHKQYVYNAIRISSFLKINSICLIVFALRNSGFEKVWKKLSTPRTKFWANAVSEIVTVVCLKRLFLFCFVCLFVCFIYQLIIVKFHSLLSNRFSFVGFFHKPLNACKPFQLSLILPFPSLKPIKPNPNLSHFFNLETLTPILTFR